MPTAFATVTVKVSCKSHWSPETTVAQITKQAREDVEGQLRHVLQNRPDITVIGKPSITMVHTDLTDAK